jgi:hypothetical protein
VVADACEFDAAVTGESQAGIDAEDTHELGYCLIRTLAEKDV